MEDLYIILALVLIIAVGIAVILITRHKESYSQNQQPIYKLIIPPNGILNKQNAELYGASGPDYTLEQAIEIYKRGLHVVKLYNKSDYKTLEESKLKDTFTNLINDILNSPPEKVKETVEEKTKGMDPFNNNRLIAAVNIASLESMGIPPVWLNSTVFMKAFNEYSDTQEELLHL